MEGQNGFSVVILCIGHISRNGCYHGLYLRKLHWFTLEFVQKVPLVVENELSKVRGKSKKSDIFEICNAKINEILIFLFTFSIVFY